MNIMHLKIFNSFRHAFRGIKFAYIHDKSFRIEVWATPLVFVFGYYFWPLAQTEILFLVLGVSLIYITELINTSFERALERLHPERHELIGRSKDIASSAVLVAVLFTFLVMILILLSHIGSTSIYG
mgnify:CR=1 FL=1